ncbi:hypothetical protein EVAR_70376_1 [Eumeta japonica]|uniref:Uncharacterized protein n=1 Tax=Eumeta variegata TaxID=151549 RepID=A0A4C1TIX5_EUMVA|nr:hypothetical protein EVAR_70376_1 [Eumeta japonica]
MTRLTPEQHLQIVQFYFENNGSVPKTYRHYDEAHFWLNGYVNKQNCRIWGEGNPQVYIEVPLYQETDWCTLGSGGIIGTYFLERWWSGTLQSMVIVIEP